MATVKLQLNQGTELQRGLSDARSDRVDISAYVSGLTGTDHTANINTAITSAIAEAGVNYTPIADLSVLRARGYPLNDTSVLVTLTYGRDRTSTPTMPATSMVTERTGYIRARGTGFTSYVDYGYGIGGTALEFGTYTKVFRYFRNRIQPISHLTMPTVLTTHPGTTVDTLIDKVNAAAYSLGGRSCTANTLRFDGATIEPVEVWSGSGTTSSIKYIVNYHFAYKKDMWKDWTYTTGYFNLSVWGTSQTQLPEATRLTIYSTANFSNIPVHS